MLKSLKLDGVGPVPGLAASFGPRLNVLTGDNGLGKSFLLDVCFWALTGTWPGGRTALPVPNGKRHKPTIAYDIKGRSQQKTDPKIATYEYTSQTWKRPSGRPFKPGLVIYASVDGSFAVWDPARNYWRDPTTGAKEGEGTPRAYQFTPETLANGLRDGDRVLCNGLIQDWVNWYYERPVGEIGHHVSAVPGTPRAYQHYDLLDEPIFHARRGDDFNPFNLLEVVVNELAHPAEPMKCGEPKRVYVDDSRKYPVLTMPYGEVPYPNWSAGVRRITGFAYLLAWTWHEHVQAARLRNDDPENRLILFVDEIEAHLHPKWQRTILPALLEVVLRLGVEVQVFAATHSPLILASLEPHFDRHQDKLFWFDLHEQTVQFHDYPWASQGDVVGWLTSEIFGLKQARSREAEVAIEAAEAFMRGDTDKLPAELKTKAAIDKALKESLPGLDPFWPRWVVEVGR